MQSFMLNNIKPGTIILSKARVLTPEHSLKDIAQSISTGEILLISICLFIIIFAPLLMVPIDERTYRSLNKKRLRAEKAQELREDFPIIYSTISSIVNLSVKAFRFIYEKMSFTYYSYMAEWEYRVAKINSVPGLFYERMRVEKTGESEGETDAA